jgi:hypothetical protein
MKACSILYHITTHLGLAEEIIEHFQKECIKAPIAGFHVTEFPLWKLGCLLNEEWLEEDILNAMAELLYFRTAASAKDIEFLYLPTLTFNDARRLYNSHPRVYGPNLTAFCCLLRQEAINTVGLDVWHNNHYHAFIYHSTDGVLIHGDSQHGSPPSDVLPIVNWILDGLSYLRPTRIYDGEIGLQSHGGIGSCAVAAHNFIECRVDEAVPQWEPNYLGGFRDKALMDLIIYHCEAVDAEVRSFKYYSASAHILDASSSLI